MGQHFLVRKYRKGTDAAGVMATGTGAPEEGSDSVGKRDGITRGQFRWNFAATAFGGQKEQPQSNREEFETRTNRIIRPWDLAGFASISRGKTDHGILRGEDGPRARRLQGVCPPGLGLRQSSGALEMAVKWPVATVCYRERPVPKRSPTQPEFRLPAVDPVFHCPRRAVLIKPGRLSKRLKAYQILGLHPDSPLEEVRRVYRLRVKACHPDQYGDDPVRLKAGQDELTELNLAYEILLKEESEPVRAAPTVYSSFRYRERTVRRKPRFGPDSGFGTRQVAWWFLPLVVILLVVYFYYALQPMGGGVGGISPK